MNSLQQNSSFIWFSGFLSNPSLWEAATRQTDIKRLGDIKGAQALNHQSSFAAQTVTASLVFHFPPLQKQHESLRWGEALASSSDSPSSHCWKSGCLHSGCEIAPIYKATLDLFIFLLPGP